MPLYFENPNGQIYVRVARDMWNVVPSYRGSPMWIMARRDFATDLLLSGAIRSGWLPIDKVIGCYPLRNGSVKGELRGPTPDVRPYNSDLDHWQYGSGLSALTSAMRILRGDRPSRFKSGDQHHIGHVSYRGVVKPVFDSGHFTVGTPLRRRALELYPEDSRADQKVWPGGITTGSGYWSVDVGISYPNYSFSPVGGYTGIGSDAPWMDHRDAIQHIDDTCGGSFSITFPFTYESGFYRIEEYSATGFTHSALDSDYITVSYSFTWVCRVYTSNYVYQGEAIRSFDVSHIYDSRLDFAPPDFHLSDGMTVSVHPGSTGISHRAEYRCTAKSGPSWGDDWFPSGFCTVGITSTAHSNLSNYYFCSELSQSDSSTPLMNISAFAKRNYLKDFEANVLQQMPSIRCSSFLSCSDALDFIVDGIDQNMVETIAEVGELVEILPDISSAISSVVKLRGGNLIGSFKDLIDFLTALRLQASFSWTPNLELLQKTIPDIVRLSSTISSLDTSRLLRAYGATSYEFPEGEFGRESTSLVTRTMVLYHSNPRSTLSDILELRRFGILPSPSALWDVVPLSFVLDWFTNVGTRLRMLESISLIAVMDIQSYTHSYLIRSPLLESELFPYGLYASSTEGSESWPELRLYIREISAYTPAPRSGKYDFASPAIPSWMTPAALAWQIFVK